MNKVDYTKPIQVGTYNGYPMDSVAVSEAEIAHYVAYGTHTSVACSPFDDYGLPYTSEEMLAKGLEGVASTHPVVNYPVESTEVFYVYKGPADGLFVTRTLDSVRSSYSIFGTVPQGVARIAISSVDGDWVSADNNTEVIDVGRVLSDQYFT